MSDLAGQGIEPQTYRIDSSVLATELLLLMFYSVYVQVDYLYSFQDPVQVIFLRSALKLYQAVAGGSEEFFVELLTQFLEADHTHKSFIRSLLLEQGLQVSYDAVTFFYS